jgi:hypothetical protein
MHPDFILKFKHRELYTVDYHDLERFVKKCYPSIKEYDFPAVEECGNDTDHEFNVTGNLAKCDATSASDIKMTGNVPLWHNHVVLDMLCADGFIPAGNYLVKVSW